MTEVSVETCFTDLKVLSLFLNYKLLNFIIFGLTCRENRHLSTSSPKHFLKMTEVSVETCFTDLKVLSLFLNYKLLNFIIFGLTCRENRHLSTSSPKHFHMFVLCICCSCLRDSSDK